MALYRVFIATTGVAATLFSGLVLFSLDARIDQRIAHRLTDYVEVKRYEREQKQHEHWSDDQVSEINKRFDAIEVVMNARTSVLSQIIENQATIMQDLRILKERATKAP